MNTIAFQTLEHDSKTHQAVRRMIRPVARKTTKDPMKLLPFLFQFASPRFSEANQLIAVSRKSMPDQGGAAGSLFLPFRSPSNQQCVVAIRSWQNNQRF